MIQKVAHGVCWLPASNEIPEFILSITKIKFVKICKVYLPDEYNVIAACALMSAVPHKTNLLEDFH